MKRNILNIIKFVALVICVFLLPKPNNAKALEVDHVNPEECSHVYDEYNPCDHDCNLCGFIRDVVHDYEWYYDHDETGHWPACRDCGARDIDYKDHMESHSVWYYSHKIIDGEMYHIGCCETCGYEVEREKVEYTKEQYEYYSYPGGYTIDNEYHLLVCPLCGDWDALTEKHTFDSNNTCTSCGYIASKICEHEFEDTLYTYYNNYTEGMHIKKCKNCDKSIYCDSYEVEFTNEGETHSWKCNDCGYESGSVAHTLTYRYVEPDENTHKFANVCACGYYELIEVQEHQYYHRCGIVDCEDGIRRIASWEMCSCGLEKPGSLEYYTGACDTYCFYNFETQEYHFATQWLNNESKCNWISMGHYEHYAVTETHHIYECARCTLLEKVEEEHVFDIWKENKNGVHWAECKCGYIDKTSYGTHKSDKVVVLDSNYHYFTCECGLRTDFNDYPHVEITKYEQIDENAHRVITLCKDCGYIISDITEEHRKEGYECYWHCPYCMFQSEINHSFTVDDYDETYHWKICDICGAKDDLGKVEHIFDNNCDTDCANCQYIREITHDYSEVVYNEDEHWHICSVCADVKIDSNEAHYYANNDDITCEACEYKRDYVTLYNFINSDKYKSMLHNSDNILLLSNVEEKNNIIIDILKYIVGGLLVMVLLFWPYRKKRFKS